VSATRLEQQREGGKKIVEEEGGGEGSSCVQKLLRLSIDFIHPSVAAPG
jgi:hypothetical protein